MKFKSDIEAEANVDIDGDILFNGDTTIQLSSTLLKIGDIDGSGSTMSMDFIVDGAEAMQIEDSTEIFIASKIGHIGDQNTFFEFPSADTITLTTGGSERMRVDSSGDVGIGLTSPDEKLHVNGTIKAETGFKYEYSGTDTFQITSIFGSPYIFVDSGDTLNIGGGPGSIANNLQVGSGSVTADEFYTDDKIIHTGDTDTYFSFPTSNVAAIVTNGSTRLYVESDGDIGVGTTTPGEKLEVNGNVKADNFIGQKTYLNWRGFMSGTSLYTLYSTGLTTSFPYAYGTVNPPYDGYVSRITMSNNAFSSYTSGPTGTSVTMDVYVNGTLLTSDTQAYTTSTPDLQVVFDFGTNAIYSAGDKIAFRVQANGIWRYINWGIELTER